MPKVSKTLTDYVVKTLKPSRDQAGAKEISDGGCRGLLLRITTRGEKLWAVRLSVNGKRAFHSIGAYPEVTLEVARQRARDYLAAAKDGASPAELDARQIAESLTVTKAHEAYLNALRPSLKASTVALKEQIFRDHVSSAIGGRLIRTVRKADLVEVVSAVTAKGFPVQANRVYSEVMALLRWCEQKDYIDGVPSVRKKDMQKVAGTAREQARRRTLTDSETGAAWRASETLGDLTRDFIRLLILTGQRRDEVRLMTWNEVDMATNLWTIPAKRYKTKIDQAVPLPPQAMDILRSRWTEGASGYVLAGRGDAKPFNGALSALRRLRKAVKGKEDFTLHDIRRTLRTGLSRLGVNETTAELVIGHIPQGIVKVYDQHDRMDERREALKKWADFVDRLATGTDNVVHLRGAS